jgi:hypothetical protein
MREQDDCELVKKVHAAFERGDIPALVELFEMTSTFSIRCRN